MDQRREMLDAIHTTASDVYKRWKHALHKHYEEHDASNVPEEFNERKDEWDWLVNHYGSPEYQGRSKANKANREKNAYHHGSGFCKIINIVKEQRYAGSKHPHIDVAVSSYYRPEREDDIGSQLVVLLKQMTSEVLTEAQSQNLDTPIEQLSPLSLETEISVADRIFGR